MASSVIHFEHEQWREITQNFIDLCMKGESIEEGEIEGKVRLFTPFRQNLSECRENDGGVC